jgi:hypothetical protein
LQTKRVELNAMTTPQLIAWLDQKMTDHGDGKLIPPTPVLEGELAERIESKVRAAITERILREANVDAQVVAAVAAITTPDGKRLARDTKKLFKLKPESEWRDHIKVVVANLKIRAVSRFNGSGFQSGRFAVAEDAQGRLQPRRC